MTDAATRHGAARRPTPQDRGGENYKGVPGCVTVALLQPLTLRKGDSIGLSVGAEYAYLDVNGHDIYLAPRRWRPGPLGRWYFDTEWEPWSPKFSNGRHWDESTAGWRAMRGWDISLPRHRQITIFASRLDLTVVGAVTGLTLLALALL